MVPISMFHMGDHMSLEMQVVCRNFTCVILYPVRILQATVSPIGMKLTVKKMIIYCTEIF